MKKYLKFFKFNNNVIIFFFQCNVYIFLYLHSFTIDILPFNIVKQLWAHYYLLQKQNCSALKIVLICKNFNFKALKSKYQKLLKFQTPKLIVKRSNVLNLRRSKFEGLEFWKLKNSNSKPLNYKYFEFYCFSSEIKIQWN